MRGSLIWANVELMDERVATRVIERPYDAVDLRFRNPLQINVLIDRIRKAPRLTSPLRHAIGQSLATRSSCGRRPCKVMLMSLRKPKCPAHRVKRPAPTVAITSAQISKPARSPIEVAATLINTDPSKIFCAARTPLIPESNAGACSKESVVGEQSH